MLLWCLGNDQKDQKALGAWTNVKPGDQQKGILTAFHTKVRFTDNIGLLSLSP